MQLSSQKFPRHVRSVECTKQRSLLNGQRIWENYERRIRCWRKDWRVMGMAVEFGSRNTHLILPHNIRHGQVKENLLCIASWAPFIWFFFFFSGIWNSQHEWNINPSPNTQNGANRMDQTTPHKRKKNISVFTISSLTKFPSKSPQNHNFQQISW